MNPFLNLLEIIKNYYLNGYYKNKNYTDEEMDILSQKDEESYLKAFSFASTHCNNNANAF